MEEVIVLKKLSLFIVFINFRFFNKLQIYIVIYIYFDYFTYFVLQMRKKIEKLFWAKT